MHEILIRYTRPRAGTTEFRQQLVHRDDTCIVTLLENSPLSGPVIVHDDAVLEPGAPVVWFTFPGLWHDIGRFHRRDGTFNGCYANILTPIRFVTPDIWETTDLFLDVWLDARGPVLLDEDELAAAVRDGAIDAGRADRARFEAADLLARAGTGEWPPPICAHWTLARARAAVGGTHGSGPV